MGNSITDIIENFKEELSSSKNETRLAGAAEFEVGNNTNVVSGEKLRKIQENTLNQTAGFLSNTFGPMGSNTKIVSGENIKNISSTYSKDGLKVLKAIINSNPIEASIVEELIEIARTVEKEVGDGTTSTVILSSLIFSKLMEIEKKYTIPPFQLIRRFESIVNEIKESIKNDSRECTLDDIYDISMISTNGNEEVSENIRKIYEEYGMNVDLSVGISNSQDSIVKAYDGLTVAEGYSDPVFVNNASNGTSEIHDASVYHFADPIDTMEMIAYFEAILDHNIYERIENDEKPIPTVITCPRISRDMSATLKQLAQHLYQYDNSGMSSAKPPILIVTNVVASDEVIMDDIANLCGCKSIRKYIDPKIKKRDQEEGKAPTVENVFEFAGKAEMVVADAKKTKFINPQHMHKIDDDGTVTEDPIYTMLVNFLIAEIENTKATASAGEVGTLKKRLSALKANMVEYLVGGVTISDRDATKDLVEDAIKNCKSAAEYGVGYAANFEALYHSYMTFMKYYESSNNDSIDNDIRASILSAYYDITKILYGTVCSDEDTIKNAIELSLDHKTPYNICNGELTDTPNGGNVKCSIMLDIEVLDTISKIISIMVTCNQCLLQATTINKY